MDQIPPGTNLWNTSAAMPPPGSGLEPNLTNPPTNKAIPQVTLSILLVLATILVVLRVYVQMFITRIGLKWDDACLLVALPGQIAYTGIIIWMSEYGLIARHIWDTPLAFFVLKLPVWTKVVNSLPQPITGFVKLALLFLYLRIFKMNSPVRVAIIACMVFVGVVYTAWTITFALVSFKTPGSIVIKLSLAQSALNVATDIFLFIIPVMGIWKLNTNVHRKMAIVLVFSTGLAAVVMGCLTLYWRHSTPRHGEVQGMPSDETWGAASIFTVSLAEIDIGIMCACLPVLMPLLPRISASANAWTEYLRSHLLGSRKSSNWKTDDPNGPNASGQGSNQKRRSQYLELSERSEVKAPGTQNSRKHWFDRSIVGVSAARPGDLEEVDQRV